jgi:hypothetical protein
MSPTSPSLDIDDSFERGLFRPPTRIPEKVKRRSLSAPSLLSILEYRSSLTHDTSLSLNPLSASKAGFPANHLSLSSSPTPKAPILEQSVFVKESLKASPPLQHSGANTEISEQESNISRSPQQTAEVSVNDISNLCHQLNLNPDSTTSHSGTRQKAADKKLAITIPNIQPLKQQEIVGDYRVVKPLVSGSFSIVKLAQNVKNNKLSALKIVAKKNLESNSVLEHGIQKEIEVLKVGDPAVYSIHGVVYLFS